MLWSRAATLLYLQCNTFLLLPLVNYSHRVYFSTRVTWFINSYLLTAFMVLMDYGLGLPIRTYEAFAFRM